VLEYSSDGVDHLGPKRPSKSCKATVRKRTPWHVKTDAVLWSTQKLHEAPKLKTPLAIIASSPCQRIAEAISTAPDG
jgi:hypothetical protein